MSKTPPHLLSSAASQGRRIGLLGGSFNPAHEGHLHISLLALKDMKLDEIWWLVSPQNPLKNEKGMAALAQRLNDAHALTADHPRIIVCDLETKLGTRFTADTLKSLRTRFPRTRFVWIMGADNLLQVVKWQRWREIFEKTDVAVYRRPPYSVGVLKGLAAKRYAGTRLPPRKAAQIGRSRKKHWVLFSNKLNDESATRIRQNRKRTLPW